MLEVCTSVYRRGGAQFVGLLMLQQVLLLLKCDNFFFNATTKEVMKMCPAENLTYGRFLIPIC